MAVSLKLKKFDVPDPLPPQKKMTFFGGGSGSLEVVTLGMSRYIRLF